MRGNRYNTVDDNFDGAVPPNNNGGATGSQAQAERSKEERQKQQEIRNSEKQRALDFVQKRKEDAAKNSPLEKAKEVALERVKSNKGNEAEVDNIQAEEEPKTKVVWNPNSRYSGMGRVIQHVKPLKKASDALLNLSGKYADEVEYEEDSFGFMSMVSKAGAKMGSVASKVGNTISKKVTSLVKTVPKVPSIKTSLPSTIVKPISTGIVHDAVPIKAVTNLPSTIVNPASTINNAVPTPKSNIGSTVGGILKSKVKSAAVGAGVGATISTVNGGNPVTGAMGGALAGGTISHLANKVYSFIDDMPEIIDRNTALMRDKIIASGYAHELSIIDKTEAKERKIDKEYLNAKKIVSNLLGNKRASSGNLRGNRGMLLKKLSNPKDEKMFSSLNLLYFHCENSQ